MMRNIIKIVLFILLMVMMSACARETPSSQVIENEENQPMQVEENILVLETIEFTEAEKEYLKTLQDKGVLKIATRNTKGIYEVKDGVIKGYNYAAVKKFADELSLTLNVKVVDSISDYFKHNGVYDKSVQSDKNLIYTPDLFEEVDLYVDLLTPVPWRKKLMDFVGFLPVREVVIHPNSVSITTTKDLHGLKAAIQPAASYYNTLQDTLIRHNIEVTYMQTETIAQSLAAVVNETADFTIMDSNRAFLEIDAYDNLSVGHPLTDIQYIGWAVKKDNLILKSILDKYWDGLKSTDQFNKLWLINYEANYYEYYKLISNNLSAIETIRFTTDELEYIEQLKARGILKIALQESKLAYNLVKGEHKGYNYLLAKNLADSLGLDLEVIIVGDFTTYFWENGQTPAQAKTDPDFFYVPDILKEVDIYTDNITHLPWRQKIFNQISVIPSRAVFILHETSDIHSIEDLNNKRIAINRDTSFELILQEVIDQYDLTVEIVDVNTIESGFDLVESKEVDATMNDSNFGLLMLQDYENLEARFSASEISTIGWATKKDDPILASILTKYIDATKQNGEFESYWNKTYDVSYIEYLRLLTD